MPPPSPVPARGSPRRAAPAIVAVACAHAARPALAAEDSSFEGVFVPDVEGFRQEGELRIPWKPFAVASIALAFVVAAAAVIVLAGRITDRRRRAPPRSILRQRRR